MAILIVDDDRGMRGVLCRFLGQITDAYVIEAADGESSLRIARSTGFSFQLLISDISLGHGMDGVQLARELSIMSPETKVILISGDETRRVGLPREWCFVPKPFALSELLSAVRALLPECCLRLDDAGSIGGVCR